MTEDLKTPPEEDFVPADDTVIGKAFRVSLAVIAAVVAVAALLFYLARRPQEAAPEQVIETAAPEVVVQAAEAPPIRFTDVTAEAGIGEGIGAPSRRMLSFGVLSQVEGVLTFGLGAAEAVDQVEIFWPDGRREVVAGVETDRLLRVEQDG